MLGNSSVLCRSLHSDRERRLHLDPQALGSLSQNYTTPFLLGSNDRFQLVYVFFLDLARSAYRSLARSRIFESSAQSLNSVGIFHSFEGILTAAAPCGGHTCSKGSHGANLKLLKIRELIALLITKAREVTKARNFLGLMFGFVTARLS